MKQTIKRKNGLDKFKELVSEVKELLFGKKERNDAKEYDAQQLAKEKLQRSKRKSKNNMANVKPPRNTGRRIRS